MAADAVTTCDDLASAARIYEAQSAARVEPWFHFSVVSEQMRPRVPSATAPHSPASPRPDGDAGAAGLDIFGAITASNTDPELVRLALRVINLLEPPNALWARLPDLQRSASEAATAAAERRATRPRRPRPTRDEILAVGA